MHANSHSLSPGMSAPLALPNGGDTRLDSGSDVLDLVTINVGGTRFETSWSTLLSIPNTRLSDITRKSKCYNSAKDEFFFDRNALLFGHILDFYRTGELHFPHNCCGPSIKKELIFWRIDEADIAPCCWHRYREFEEKNKIFDRIERAFDSTPTQPCNTFTAEQMVAPSAYAVWKRRIYLFLEDPMSSRGAKIWTVMFLFVVLLSIGILCMETHPLFRIDNKDDEMKCCSTPNTTTLFTPHPLTQSPINLTTPTPHLPFSDNKKFNMLVSTKPRPSLEYMDTFCAVFFTIEFILRFVVSPDKVAFWKSLMNYIDILCVMPMWIKYLLGMLEKNLTSENTELLPLVFVIMLLRVLRICRVLRLARHYVGVKILLLALKASLRELCMLLVFVFIVILIFAIVIYYAEFFVKDTFGSIPEGFWWAIITLTTVGYGDMYPKSLPGYLVGAACALTGILATGLPVPIIAQNFNLYYSHAQMKEAAANRKTNRRSLSTLTQMTSDPKRESYLLREDAV